ncbi:protein of unknown function [uncultured Sphingopyxis sp.]|uniref:Uncharacterized protein n=1 Tax=uncultured Sphingopyxis sp. TaxID=310581 RepID=A0A1Y5PWA7_9SPHN|nr:protein of unknown function [uncultured Sphingopyxis sp.]
MTVTPAEAGAAGGLCLDRWTRPTTAPAFAGATAPIEGLYFARHDRHREAVVILTRRQGSA